MNQSSIADDTETGGEEVLVLTYTRVLLMYVSRVLEDDLNKFVLLLFSLFG